MNSRLQSHIFWGKHAPLYTLTGAFLLIIASSRLAFAIFCAGALLWVYGLTAIAYYSSRKIMPERGKIIIYLFLTSFICSIYMLLMSFINPLLVVASWFFLVLIPPCCVSSGLFEYSDSQDDGITDILFRVELEAGYLGLLIIAISLIREPLGIGSLSFPGSPYGINEIFGTIEDGEGFIPIRLISASAGWLIILGLSVAAFRYFLNHNSQKEDEL